MNCVGTDLSPLCALLTRVKVRSVEVVDEIRACVKILLERPDLDPDRRDQVKAKDERVAEFFEIARMVTYSDVARRGRRALVAYRKNLGGMLESVEAHAAAIEEFRLKPGWVRAQVGDARDLSTTGVEPGTVSCIVTSPPYSIALDYVKNDKHALEALGVDMEGLSDVMTGVRGRGARQRLDLYNQDMQMVFGEVAKALRPGGGAAFVIGDATVDRLEWTTTETMSQWAAAAGLRRERNISKIVFGLYNVMLDEKILVFRKPGL